MVSGNAIVSPWGAGHHSGTESAPADTTVCTVTGTMNPDTVAVLNDALAGARRDDHSHLVIDLSAVTSMDATGLYTLFEALSEHNLGGAGHLAVVVDPHSEAIHELHIVALEAAFDLYHDLAGALQAMSARLAH